MRSARWSVPNAMLAGVLALALCSGGTVFGGGVFSRAWADEAEEAQRAVDDAQATLDDAEAHMESIAGDYDALKQDVEELQARVDEISAQAMDAQQAVIEGRAALGKTAVHEYLNGGASQSLVTMVLEARSFSDLIRNLTYLDSIMQFHADEVEAQKERSAKYEKLIDDLNFQKDEQEKKLEELEAKRAEAETVLSQASSKLSNAQSDQAARLEALRQKAEELAAADGATGPVIDENADTIGREDVVDSNTPVQPNLDPNPPAPAPEPSPDPDPAPSPAPDSRHQLVDRHRVRVRRFHRSVHAEPRHHGERVGVRRQLHGRGHPDVMAELPLVFRPHRRDLLQRANRAGHRKRLRWHGPGQPISRPAARRMEGLRLLVVPRLGSAHGQLPLPVERRDASL